MDFATLEVFRPVAPGGQSINRAAHLLGQIQRP